MPWQELADRVGPILGFVLCITVVAELADRAGVFAVLADRLAAVAAGSVLRLWLLIVLLATVATAVLSLDTTAVLVTPVVLALAGQLGLDRALFAYTTVWLANTASLLLPVSNLTNLLSLHVLRLRAPQFVSLTWPAAAAAIVVTVVALAVLFRRSLGGRYTRTAVGAGPDRLLLVLGLVVCTGLAVAFAAGVDVTAAAAVGALAMVVGFGVRAPAVLTWRLLPLPLLLGTAALFLVVTFLDHHGLPRLLQLLAGTGGGWADLLRLAAAGTLVANLVNNLPAYLSLEPVAAGSALRVAALLVGVNAGCLVTPWASLATLLWAGRCRAAGVPVRWTTFALRGIVVVPLLVVSATTALLLSP